MQSADVAISSLFYAAGSSTVDVAALGSVRVVSAHRQHCGDRGDRAEQEQSLNTPAPDDLQHGRSFATAPLKKCIPPTAAPESVAWAVGAAMRPPPMEIHGSSTAAHAPEPIAPVLDAAALDTLRPRLRAGCPVAFDAYRLHLLAEAAITSPPPALASHTPSPPSTPAYWGGETRSISAILQRETLASDAPFTPPRRDDAHRVIGMLDAGSPLSTMQSVARAAELAEVRMYGLWPTVKRIHRQPHQGASPRRHARGGRAGSSRSSHGHGHPHAN